MRLLSAITTLAVLSQTNAYFSMKAYAPLHPRIHERVINAYDYAFVIGAENPSTYCDLEDSDECPEGVSTLINEDMTLLAV